MKRYRLVRQGSDGCGCWAGLVGAGFVSMLALSFGAPAARGQSDPWIHFVEDPSRIVADPSVGSDDTEEKDIATADLNGDGNIDLVIVRKVPFSNPGGKRNVLFMNEDGTMVDRTSELAPGFLDLTDDRDVVIVDVDPIPGGEVLLDVVTAATFGDPPRVYINLGCCNTACSPSNPCQPANQMPCNDPGNPT